jgi:formate dehydrogenase subunit gamma
VSWLTVIGGGLAAATGHVLLFPFQPTDIAGMQIAQLVHRLLEPPLVAAMLAHIYIGSVGMEGAFAAMSSGQVDLNWARENHGEWLDEELARTGGSDAADLRDARAAGTD